MEQRVLGKTGLKVGVLGFGGADVGYKGASFDLVSSILNAAIDAGLNAVDTAECYVTSEEHIGRALGKRRKDVLLFTKCGHANGYSDPDFSDRKRLEASLERSLSRLRTDYVDLFQIHSCGKEILERGEIVRFMQDAKAKGKARFIGYSGDGEDALSAVRTGAFDALQISVSLADQEAVDKVLPEAVKAGMGVIAKRPIGNAAWRHQTRPGDYYAPYWERFQALDYEFLKQEATAVPMALRFTLSVPGVATAIVGTQRAGRWQQNASIAALGPLEKDDYEAIRRRWKEKAGPDWEGQV